METTIFEKIINREIPASIVYEDELTIAILDIHPKTLGHTLVIPKQVSRTFLEMDVQSLGQYFATIQKIAQAIKDSISADGLNIVINVESAGGQEVFHTHVHIIPRHNGKHITLNTPEQTAYSSPEEMQKYADTIKAYLP
jgi:histidine triad (HIT) family protein